MPEEKSQCEQRGAGADPPGTTMGTEFSQPELDTATATLERQVNQVRRKALKIAYRARPWLDRDGQMALDQIVLNPDPTPLLVDLIGLLQDDIDRLITLEYHLVRMLPLTILPASASGQDPARVKPPQCDNPVPTTAELFPDGGAIDLLCSGQLISLQAGCEIIAPVIEHSGRRYCAAKLDPSLHAAVCLPAEAADYGTTDVLVEGMAASARDALGAGHNQALILSTTLLATWVAECLLGGAPILNLWGPAEKRAPALAFVLALCRRPLALVEASIEPLAELPRAFCPTIILSDPRTASLRGLLAAAGQNGATRLRHGRLFTARCCLIVFTELPSALIRFRLPLSALASKRLTPLDAAELRSRFQGQLLQYRLVRHQAIANSRFATEGFAPGVATVADQLGAAVEGAEKLQTEIVKALQDLDEEQRQESSQSAEAIAVAAMLLPSHEQKRSALIGDLSEIANTILIERGEHPVFTP